MAALLLASKPPSARWWPLLLAFLSGVAAALLCVAVVGKPHAGLLFNTAAVPAEAAAVAAECPKAECPTVEIPPCQCNCNCPTCPECPAAPDAAALEAAAAAQVASQEQQHQRFCPWSLHLSVFRDREGDVGFGRGQSACIDSIIYGYDLLFEHQTMWRKMFWLGVPTEQDPTDLQVIQELLWEVRPDVLIELGTNTGGGALTFASMMHLMELATKKGDPKHKRRMRVITIDPNDFHNPHFPGLSCTEEAPCPTPDAHPLWDKHVTFIQGVPTNETILAQVQGLLEEWGAETVMVSEDSGHLYDMVLENIRAYKRFVTVGSYMLVQDTKLTRMWKHSHCDPEGKATIEEINKCWEDNRIGPLDSVIDFLKEEPEGTWATDKEREYLLYTQHADGWLKRLQ